jgi:hypothetical protein
MINATQAEWVSHRNGSGGWPFECRLAGWVLGVRFRGMEDDDGHVAGPAAEVSVNVDWVRRVAEASKPGPWETHTIRGEEMQLRAVAGMADNCAVLVFDTLGEDGARRMVALNTGHVDDCMTAVFDLGLLLDQTVEFGLNSWRGDAFHGYVVRALFDDLS